MAPIISNIGLTVKGGRGIKAGGFYKGIPLASLKFQCQVRQKVNAGLCRITCIIYARVGGIQI